MKYTVQTWQGTKDSEVDLNKEVFSQEVDKSLLYDVVEWQACRKRSGTHNTKTRSEVRGGGRKPFRQKGTGQARQGSIRSPLLEGGAVVHGPKTRSYDFPLPKKIRKKALSQALSYKLAEKELVIVKDMQLAQAKTKELSKMFGSLKWDQALLVDEKKQENFKRACSNLGKFKLIEAEGLNVYDMLKFKKLVITLASLKTIYRKCGYVSSN